MDQDDRIFNALLATGWDVKIDMAGSIIAERNQAYIRGDIRADGHIDWQGGINNVT